MVGQKHRSRSRKLRGDEAALWRDFVRSITPLRGRSKAEFAAVPEAGPQDLPGDAPPSDAPLSIPGKAAPPARATPPPLAPLDRRLRQRIARGAHAIEARLDLHGMTQAKAHAALARFLRGAQADGAKLVLVITGKGARAGKGEAGGGVLRRQVPLWLEQQDLRAYVVGFEPAHTGHGGDGALYIRVRRRRSS